MRLNQICSFLIILVFFFISCKNHNKPTVARIDPELDSILPFLKFDTSDVDINFNKYFSNVLIKLEENKLKNDTSLNNIEIYRLLVHAYAFAPFCVRIELNKSNKELYLRTGEKGDSLQLVTIISKDAFNSGYGTGKLMYSLKVNRPIQDSLVSIYWKNLSESLSSYDFWNQPTHMAIDIADGTIVIIEAIKEGKYHILHRHIGSLNREESNTFPKEFRINELLSLCKAIERFSDVRNIEDDIIMRDAVFRSNYQIEE